MTHVVEIPYNADLVAVLDALRIPWVDGRPANGSGPTTRVTLDQGVDARLERLIDQLSDLRWCYEPGRCLQLEIPWGGDDAAP